MGYKRIANIIVEDCTCRRIAEGKIRKHDSILAMSFDLVLLSSFVCLLQSA